MSLSDVDMEMMAVARALETLVPKAPSLKVRLTATRVGTLTRIHLGIGLKAVPSV